MFLSSFIGEKYIDIKYYPNNWYFYDNDISIADCDIEKIKPFTQQYCSFLWNHYISKSGRHSNLLKLDDEWPVELLKNKPIYYFNTDWNENKYYTLLRGLLKECLHFNGKDSIYLFWSPEDGIETTWEIFLGYWINFLFNDEGPILINPSSKHVIRFGSDGSVQIGERTDLC